MRVLVTGAFGFVGTAVARRLALAGHDVVALTSRPAGLRLPAGDAGEVRRADVRDQRAVRAAVAGVAAVCHLAGLSRVRESFERPAEYQAVNAGGTKTLLTALAAEAAERGAPARFVFASSAAVCGVPRRQPVTEDVPLAPISPYGRSKADAEQAVAAAADGTLGTARLRIFNVAGAVAGVTDTDLTRVIPKALAVADGRAPCFTMNGDGGAVRDYVHVDDVAAAFALALDACRPGSSAVYNVGATAASVADVIAAAEQVTGRRITVIRNPPGDEPPLLIADRTRISRELGWEPGRSSLRQIITDAWDAAR